MLIARLISRPRRPFRRLRVGNQQNRADEIERRKYLVTFEGATPVLPLKWLRLLFAVVSGNLRMAEGGSDVARTGGRAREAWERLREKAPFGLIGRPGWP